jgi:hypothetical protein
MRNRAVKLKALPDFWGLFAELSCSFMNRSIDLFHTKRPLGCQTCAT